MDWQPIETAPNWPRMLLWANGKICIGVKHSDTWFTKCDASWPDDDIRPTHWMSLPEPPR